MYAIIKTGGNQFKVEQGMKLMVPRLTGEEGSDHTFEEV
ncbi:MAG: bL21 family ribosomal protein, partial [Candidatus Sabulitectum sp.]|nr:bL21 family ribosomal protein [Candidatus Sabulitectum sp.]